MCGILWHRLDKGGFSFRVKGLGICDWGSLSHGRVHREREREREREKLVAESGAVVVGDTLFIVCFDLINQLQAWGVVMTSTFHHVLIPLAQGLYGIVCFSQETVGAF